MLTRVHWTACRYFMIPNTPLSPILIQIENKTLFNLVTHLFCICNCITCRSYKCSCISCEIVLIYQSIFKSAHQLSLPAALRTLNKFIIFAHLLFMLKTTRLLFFFFLQDCSVRAFRSPLILFVVDRKCCSVSCSCFSQTSLLESFPPQPEVKLEQSRAPTPAEFCQINMIFGDCFSGRKTEAAPHLRTCDKFPDEQFCSWFQSKQKTIPLCLSFSVPNPGVVVFFLNKCLSNTYLFCRNLTVIIESIMKHHVCYL